MDKHSPTPWRLDGRTIRDAEGDVVVSTFSPANMETRQLIVEAVNRFTAHRENAPLPSARGAVLSSASRPTGAKLLPAVTAGETASMLLPWTVEGPFPGQRETKKRHGFAPYANIVNRIGNYVAQGLTPEVAAGIVDAVNGVDATLKLQRKLLGWSMERDRLRDLVRRLADSLDYALDQAGGEWQSDLDSGSEPNFSKERALLREAREAIKEDKS